MILSEMKLSWSELTFLTGLNSHQMKMLCLFCKEAQWTLDISPCVKYYCHITIGSTIGSAIDSTIDSTIGSTNLLLPTCCFQGCMICRWEGIKLVSVYK